MALALPCVPVVWIAVLRPPTSRAQGPVASSAEVRSWPCVAVAKLEPDHEVSCTLPDPEVARPPVCSTRETDTSCLFEVKATVSIPPGAEKRELGVKLELDGEESAVKRCPDERTCPDSDEKEVPDCTEVKGAADGYQYGQTFGFLRFGAVKTTIAATLTFVRYVKGAGDRFAPMAADAAACQGPKPKPPAPNCRTRPGDCRQITFSVNCCGTMTVTPPGVVLHSDSADESILLHYPANTDVTVKLAPAADYDDPTLQADFLDCNGGGNCMFSTGGASELDLGGAVFGSFQCETPQTGCPATTGAADLVGGQTRIRRTPHRRTLVHLARARTGERP